jgi:hypothetical protein
VPVAAYGLDGVAVGGELAEPVEDPPPAHAGNCDEVADGNAFGWCGGQRASEDRVWVLLPVAGVRLVCAGIVGYGGPVAGAGVSRGCGAGGGPAASARREMASSGGRLATRRSAPS